MSFPSAHRTERQGHTTEKKVMIYKWTRWFPSHLTELLSFEELLFVDYKENLITLEILREFHNEPSLHFVGSKSNYNHDLQIPILEAGY